MPSYRVTVAVRATRAGHHPDEVMALARAAVSGVAHLDDSRIELVHGQPVVRLRFTVAPCADHEEDAAAAHVAGSTARQLIAVASLGRCWLELRRGNRWVPRPLPRIDA